MSELRDNLINNEIEKLNNAYLNKINIDDLNGIHLNHEPFTHCSISNLLNDQEFIDNLKNELTKIKYKEKSNDLYKFHQTADLSKTKSPAIQKFKEILYGKVLNVLKEMTSIELISNKIDMTSSKYKHTDYLLCHDDDIHGEKEGRRIAFVYYLVPNDWSNVDGGQLDLFKINDNFQPTEIVKSIVPKANSLLFFEVSDRSFHQVAEVLSKNKTRLSIHGWFHGAVNYRPVQHIEIMQNPKPLINIEHDLYFEWLIEKYLDPVNQMQIRKKFGKNSEIRLEKFFNNEKYEQVSNALKDESILWKMKGPRNRRHYEVADENSLPLIVLEMIKILTCEFMGVTLSNLSGLGLHESCKGKTIDDSDSEDDDLSSNEEEEIKPGTSKSLSVDKSKTGKIFDNKEEEEDESESDEPITKKIKQDLIDDESLKSTPTCYVEVRRWKQGSYTLITDDDHELQINALDVNLFFNTSKWDESYGGNISYIARDEDDELLTVIPENNCLAMVYRDTETLRFTKYITSRLKKTFYEISLVYYE